MQVEDLDGNVLRLGSDPRPGEPDGEFARSLRDKYLPQLESYRSVLEQVFNRKVSRLLIYSTVLARLV